jgi:hypothetical protein
MIGPPTNAPSLVARGCTNELVLTNSPRRHGHDGGDQVNPRQVRHHPHQHDRDGRHDAINPQLAEPVGQPADRGRRHERQAAACDQEQRQARLGTPTWTTK